MRHKILLLIAIMVMISFTNCYAQKNLQIYKVENILLHKRTNQDNINMALFQILHNRPDINVDYARLLARHTYEVGKHFNVPLFIVLAIMNVESNYILNAYNSKSKDFGLMQVNAYHVRVSGLNVKRLLNDSYYNIYHGVRIFSWFYGAYDLDEAIMRYNCGTRNNCIKQKRVRNYLDKVKRSM